MGNYTRMFSEYLFSRHLYEAMLKILYGQQCEIDEKIIFEFDSVVDFIKLYNQRNFEKLELIGEMNTKTMDVLKNVSWNKTMVFNFFKKKTLI